MEGRPALGLEGGLRSLRGVPRKCSVSATVNKGLLPLGPCAFFHPHPRNSSQTFGSLHTPGGAHHCLDLPSALSLLPPWPAG